MSEAPNAPEIPPLSFTRSDEYKRIFADFFRTRLGTGEITTIVSKVTHGPNMNVEGNIIEEQIELVMTWSSVKMLQLHLMSLVSAIEEEVGYIPIPANFLANLEAGHDAQRNLVRSLGLSAATAEPDQEPEAERNKRPRRGG